MTRRLGFTLIELLVVIGLVALLIGLLLPALGVARKRAKQVPCAANLRSLMQANYQYATDSKGHMPFSNSATLESGSYPHPGWLYDLPKTDVTASDDRKTKFKSPDVQSGALWFYLKTRATYSCPLDELFGSSGQGSHAMTSFMMNAAVTGLGNKTYPPIRLERFKANQVCYWEPEETKDWNDGNTEPTNGHTTRHLGACSAGFFDSHVVFWPVGDFDKQYKTNYASSLWCDPRYPDRGRDPASLGHFFSDEPGYPS